MRIRKLSNFDHVHGVMSQTRASGNRIQSLNRISNRIHDPHAKSLAHSALAYQSTLLNHIRAMSECSIISGL